MDPTARNNLLTRIGLDAPPAADAAGLREVHRAYVSHVPFEDLAVQLAESAPIDPDALVERVLGGGRGGYCFEVNTVFALLLESLGFEVERRQAVVGPRGVHKRGAPTNHLALVVRTPADEEFVAEGGFGEGPVEPLPLAEGSTTIGAGTWGLERDDDGWWLPRIEWGSAPGFHFADEPATLADFAPHHERESTSPDSMFVQTLIVQQPHDDRIVTLRARTVFVDGPDLRKRTVLPDADAFAAALDDRFGIDPAVLGEERINRLWACAVEQHDAHSRGAS